MINNKTLNEEEINDYDPSFNILIFKINLIIGKAIR